MGQPAVDQTGRKDITDERYYMASQWQLMRRKLFRHKLALLGGSLLLLLYVLAVLCEFTSPYDPQRRFPDYIYANPQRIHIFDGKKLTRPFVYGLALSRDPVSLRRIYKEDTTAKHTIHLFVQGDSYKLFGFIPATIHLVGVEEGTLFLFGTDKLGRDLLSRNFYGARISLFIGLLGVAISFTLGCILGGLSGYFGGVLDMVMQRGIEFIGSIPTIPLWMALSAALPPHWPPLRVYLGIVLILSLKGWGGLARTVRGKLLAVREEDFVLAAKISGMRPFRIITRHLLPSFLSYLIVRVTLAIPGMIMGETALSFLGLGLRPPVVSWGVLLKDAQNVRTIVHTPWLMIPAAFVVITVLAFNFLGDGMRDAADPYK